MFNNKTELFANNLDKCIKEYSQSITDVMPASTKIETVKRKLFPNSCRVQNKAQDSLNSTRVQHIGDTLDATMQQQEGDDIEEEMKMDDKHASRHLLELYVQPQRSHEHTFKVTNFTAEKKQEMLKKVCQLVPEQRVPFDILTRYVKDIRMTSLLDKRPPSPPLLVVHGGAGAGKSTVIRAIYDWCEFYLRAPGDKVDQPHIIRCAPTGAAAALINGITLHSAFHLSFGHKYHSLSDQNRDKLRDKFKILKIIIIDEFSMISADLFYNLHLRLQEIKQNEDIFGGIPILLFGDLLQLRPVLAKYIFECPKSPDLKDYYSVTNLFK